MRTDNRAWRPARRTMPPVRAVVGAALLALAVGCTDAAEPSAVTAPSTSTTTTTTTTTTTATTVPITSAATTVPITSASQVDSRGIAPVVLPMSLADVNAILGTDVQRDPGSANSCASLAVPGTDGVSLWLDGTTVTRVDVHGPSVRTTTGVGVGSTEREVRAAYGAQVREGLHPFDGWSRLDVGDPAAPEHGLAFVLEGDVVESYRAGLTDAIGLWDCA